MRAAEGREMTLAEIERKEAETRQLLFKLRFQISMGQAEGIRKYRAARKDLARLLTVAGEKARAAAGGGGDDA